MTSGERRCCQQVRSTEPRVSCVRAPAGVGVRDIRLREHRREQAFRSAAPGSAIAGPPSYAL